jgi:chemotaxis protein methyltransferase CheR
MSHEDCTVFLQWALPRLRMRWPGFRRVRSQVCKRIGRRIRQLEIEGFGAYRTYLESHTDEWARLDGMCRITISRFWRDRALHEVLFDEVLPVLAQGAITRGSGTLRCWSCGCASGEEPYSLLIGWRFRLAQPFPSIRFEILATDSDPAMLERAQRAVFSEGSLRDLPEPWRERAFDPHDDGLRMREECRQGVLWLCQDVRQQIPAGPFDLVLCRNLVFTYYEVSLQREVAERLDSALRPGGALVLGSHESLPEGASDFEPWGVHRALFRRIGGP